MHGSCGSTPTKRWIASSRGRCHALDLVRGRRPTRRSGRPSPAALASATRRTSASCGVAALALTGDQQRGRLNGGQHASHVGLPPDLVQLDRDVGRAGVATELGQPRISSSEGTKAGSALSELLGPDPRVLDRAPVLERLPLCATSSGPKPHGIVGRPESCAAPDSTTPARGPARDRYAASNTHGAMLSNQAPEHAHSVIPTASSTARRSAARVSRLGGRDVPARQAGAPPVVQDQAGERRQPFKPRADPTEDSHPHRCCPQKSNCQAMSTGPSPTT